MVSELLFAEPVSRSRLLPAEYIEQKLCQRVCADKLFVFKARYLADKPLTSLVFAWSEPNFFLCRKIGLVGWLLKRQVTLRVTNESERSGQVRRVV